MKYTQFIIFEIAAGCNRSQEHTLCPVGHPERWNNNRHRIRMEDAAIVEVAAKAYAMGFTGKIAFHHYCEPLTEWPRLRRVIGEIRRQVPASRFLLWTNGDLFPEDLGEFSGVFETMCITNYAGRDLSRLASVCGDIRPISTQLDWRLSPPQQHGREPHCIRPYLEIIFDYYGMVRTCCMDWRGETSIGNIHDTPFEDLWQRWLVLRDRLAATPMAEDAPPRCLSCGTRYVHLADYVPEVAARTLDYLRGQK